MIAIRPTFEKQHGFHLVLSCFESVPRRENPSSVDFSSFPGPHAGNGADRWPDSAWAVSTIIDDELTVSGVWRPGVQSQLCHELG